MLYSVHKTEGTSPWPTSRVFPQGLGLIILHKNDAGSAAGSLDPNIPPLFCACLPPPYPPRVADLLATATPPLTALPTSTSTANFENHGRTPPHGNATTRNSPAPFIGAGFFFAHSSFLADVPYDPYLPWVFMGEEILVSLRMWTWGYDIYSPTRNVLSHLYGRKHLPKFWETVNRCVWFCVLRVCVCVYLWLRLRPHMVFNGTRLVRDACICPGLAFPCCPLEWLASPLLPIAGSRGAWLSLSGCHCCCRC